MQRWQAGQRLFISCKKKKKTVAIFFPSSHCLKATLATMWTIPALVMATVCVWSCPSCKRGKTKHFVTADFGLSGSSRFLRWTHLLRDKPEECSHRAREVFCVTWTWPGFVYSKPCYCLIDMWGGFDLWHLPSQGLSLSSLVLSISNLVKVQ